MSKPEWGVKRMCPKCNTRFYDMKRQPLTCPKCASVFDVESFAKKRRGRPSTTESKAPPLPTELDETLDLELAEELSTINGDEVLEDTSDFGEDEDVVGIEKPPEED